MIGCSCEVCRSPDARDKRLRSSVWLQVGNLSIVIDTGPDFRYQMLRASVNRLDAVLLTHGHKDHIAGLDDVRAYNYLQRRMMDVYGTAETLNTLRREFAYAFETPAYPGIPELALHTIEPDQVFQIGGEPVIPIRVLHHKMEVLGFRIQNFTYITDANYIYASELDKVRGSEVLVLNALRHQEHVSHFTLGEAVGVARDIGVRNTYFTHISHQLGRHADIDPHLPEGMRLAYDGLTIRV